MFTSEYLAKIAKDYRCDCAPDEDTCRMLLNHLKLSDKECPDCLTLKMFTDLITGKKSYLDILDIIGKASRYNDMLSLHNCLKDMMIDYRNKAKEAKENGDSEKEKEFEIQARIYREKTETAWAMIQISGATLTNIKIGNDHKWIVDIDRIW